MHLWNDSRHSPAPIPFTALYVRAHCCTREIYLGSQVRKAMCVPLSLCLSLCSKAVIVSLSFPCLVFPSIMHHSLEYCHAHPLAYCQLSQQSIHPVGQGPSVTHGTQNIQAGIYEETPGGPSCWHWPDELQGSDGRAADDQHQDWLLLVVRFPKLYPLRTDWKTDHENDSKDSKTVLLTLDILQLFISKCLRK